MTSLISAVNLAMIFSFASNTAYVISDTHKVLLHMLSVSLKTVDIFYDALSTLNLNI